MLTQSNSFIRAISGPDVIKSELPFSAAIRAGDFVFISGMASADEQGHIIHDTFENEVRRAFKNLSRILTAAGLDFSHVVQTRCYLAEQKNWDLHNHIYREFFAEPYPARTTLVGCLGTLVKYEIDAIAWVGAKTNDSRAS